MPSTSSRIASGWSPFGSNSDWMTKRLPPSDFSGRGGRCGSHGCRREFLAALAQQIFQRLRGGGDAHRRQPAARLRQVGLRQPVFRIVFRRRGRRLIVAEPELFRQRRIEPADRRAGVVALRRFVETRFFRKFGRRLARRVGGGEIGAALERIIRRRLQATLTCHSGTARRAGPGIQRLARWLFLDSGFARFARAPE